MAQQQIFSTGKQKPLRNKGKLLKLDFDRFTYITNKYRADRSIVLNLYTRDTQYNLELIDKIKNKIHDRVNWELGNELLNYEYKSLYFSDSQWNRKVYLSKATVIAKYIKEKYPQDRVGIVGRELVDERRIQDSASTKTTKKEAEWNNLIADNEYIDAVIFHSYIFLNNIGDWQGKRVGNINCETSNIKLKKAALEFRWVLGQAQSVPKAYSRYVRNILPNKKIWTTESGLLDTGDSEILDWKIGVLRTLFDLTYYLSWVTNMDNLDVYMYHLLGYGRGSVHALLLDGSLNSNTMAYSFIETILDGANNVFFNEYRTANSLRSLNNDKPINTVQVLGRETENELKLLLINIGPEPVVIKLPEKHYCVRVIGGHPFSELKSGQYKSLQDIALYELTSDQWDIPGFSASLMEKCSGA